MKVLLVVLLLAGLVIQAHAGNQEINHGKAGNTRAAGVCRGVHNCK
jgi:hypothetical protein